MNVLMIYGGKSSEHDISVVTACLARGHFADNLYGVYFDKNNVPYLVGNDVSPRGHNRKFRKKVVFCFGESAVALRRGPFVGRKIHIDVAVNCCHGVCGEDGTVAALCSLLGVPLVGSDIGSSAVAMDKALTKVVMRGLGLPTLGGTVVNRGNDVDWDSIKLPTVVKPCRLGSSIGVKLCRTMDELQTALDVAFTYDDKVLCEDALTDCTELNCSAMKVQAQTRLSRVDVPVTAHDILTFEDKYLSGSKMSFAPSDKTLLNEELVSNVRQLTRQVYELLGFSGVVRVDYLLDNTDGKVYVNEINSVPGSLAYGLWQGDYGMTEYGNALIAQAMQDYKDKSALVTDFASPVLSSGKGKK